ncbi:SpoIIE family protein phosphatase [Streptomyces sp. NPDC056527]|uniref:SpoIIE family protein phosphatase n=1 Tax=Streptomyces sp. NPDC056527 TaxID=3345853 RepID=UPI00368531C7
MTKLRGLLTPEHFSSGAVPPLWRLREQLNGVGLAWELAEAVADVCFPAETGKQTSERLAQIRPLWTAASTAPTAPNPTYDLIGAQQRTIAALEELNRVRQTLEVSEQARVQALQVATVLFAFLGQAQAQVAQLTRRLDAIRASSSSAPADVRAAESRLDRAQQQTKDLRQQLARAQEERDRFQEVADQAARQVRHLEEELRDLRGAPAPAQPPQDRSAIQLPGTGGGAADDAALDEVDAVLRKARDVLDREHDAVQEAAEEVGLWEALQSDPAHDGRIVPGQAVRHEPASRSAGREGLFQTTPDNPSTSAKTGGPVYATVPSDASEIQRRMLPAALPQPTGVRLASRYLPAAETARAGGDWYDSIPLPGSRVALVVGDVMERSVASGAIMGQLRTTLQTLSGLDLPPQDVLHHLDEQAQRQSQDLLATCLYAVYDPVSHRITIANAGHPPPILLHLGGRAEVLRVPPGAPIGVGGFNFEAVELDAPAGATLLLYTDGLVESRLRDVWTGIEQLRERLAATAQLTGPDRSPPLEALCDDVLDMLGPGDRDDDIALLAARFDGIAPSDVAYWFLEPEEVSVGRARRFARRALARWDLEELSDSVELLISEIVTNAVRYSERPVTLRLLRTDVLRCEVGDDSPAMPRIHRTEEGGLGLFLVNRLATRWGATRLSGGKVVWFELKFPRG